MVRRSRCRCHFKLPCVCLSPSCLPRRHHTNLLFLFSSSQKLFHYLCSLILVRSFSAIPHTPCLRFLLLPLCCRWSPFIISESFFRGFCCCCFFFRIVGTFLHSPKCLFAATLIHPIPSTALHYNNIFAGPSFRSLLLQSSILLLLLHSYIHPIQSNPSRITISTNSKVNIH